MQSYGEYMGWLIMTLVSTYQCWESASEDRRTFHDASYMRLDISHWHAGIRCVYNLFNTMAFEGRVLASTVHIYIIRLLLKPRDLPREDGGTEVKVKACESVGQVVDTHWLSMLLAIQHFRDSWQHRQPVCINHLTNTFACFHFCFHTPSFP